MTIDAADGLLACPHCGDGLDPDGRVFRCAQGHAFDLARQGHLNLLAGPEPANADTPAMLDARARVHAAGVFDLVAEAVAAAVADDARVLVEVGAGTASYLARALDARPGARGVAVDVSRAAARRAARAHPRMASVMADVWRGLPLRDGVADAVLCVFAPRNIADFARVLRPGGLLVVATPLPEHLVELRERYGLLGIEPDKQERLREQAGRYLRALGSTPVVARPNLDAALVNDLIAMGPNAFHGTPGEVTAQQVTLAVNVAVFESDRRPLDFTGDPERTRNPR